MLYLRQLIKADVDLMCSCDMVKINFFDLFAFTGMCKILLLKHHLSPKILPNFTHCLKFLRFSKILQKIQNISSKPRWEYHAVHHSYFRVAVKLILKVRPS